MLDNPDLRIFDSHIHLLDSRYKQDLKDVSAGAEGIICMYSPGEDTDLLYDLLGNSHIWAAAGVHPHDAVNFENMKPELKNVLQHVKVKALGEIGLDYHYDYSPRDVQREVFLAQLELSLELNKPVVVHSREAHKDVMNILEKKRPSKLLIHCFTGTPAELEDFMGLDSYISLGGIVTFDKSGNSSSAVSIIPDDRLLVETDGPYLAPVPYRGRRNEPRFIAYVLEKIAGQKNMTVSELAEITYNNTLRFFDIEMEG